jgi:multidrug resistance protein MdtO
MTASNKSSPEFIAQRLTPSLSAARPDLFAEIGEFLHFLREELRPFPGRGHAVARLVIGAVIATILCQALRIPEPAFAPYLIFFLVNEEGVSSVKIGVLGMVGITVAVAVCSGISICFLDAPWFRVPVTIALIGVAIWLSRTMVLAVMGRLIAVILALYLSLADSVFNPEQLTEATLWLWSVVGIAVGVSALVSVALEPRPDLLLRALIEAELETARQALDALASGRGNGIALAKTLRRHFYAAPQRLRQLLARWRQRAWQRAYAEVDWELAIFVTERLLSTTAALAALDEPATFEVRRPEPVEGSVRTPLGRAGGTDPSTSLGMTGQIREKLAEFSRAIAELKRASREKDREAVRTLAVPSIDALPESEAKVALRELAAALADCHLIVAPLTASATETPAPKAAPKLWALVPDALTNPEYTRFALKTMLAITACEIFLNGVAWPGIRTCMITCVVTALATGGAQRQKQLLRLVGVCTGGVMGLAAVVYLVPHLDTIAGLTLVIAAGTACCAWVAAGGVRSSYAGFQMALAFFIMLLPGFATSVDLVGIRDRFVGILVGIVAMWIFVDHLWHTSSRRQLVEKLVAILRHEAGGPGIVSPALAMGEVRRRAMDFRRTVVNDLEQGRLMLDETKIELALTLEPQRVSGGALEMVARDVSFTAMAMLALNARKLRLLAEGRLAALEPALRPADEALARNFEKLAGSLDAFEQAVLQATRTEEVALPEVELEPVRVDGELQPLYQALDHGVRRIADVRWIARGLA